MTKLYEVELNSKGAPDFSTAKEVPEPRKGIGGNYKCYKCGAEIHIFDLMGEWRYCPNCGEAAIWVGEDAVGGMKG